MYFKTTIYLKIQMMIVLKVQFLIPKANVPLIYNLICSLPLPRIQLSIMVLRT